MVTLDSQSLPQPGKDSSPLILSKNTKFQFFVLPHSSQKKKEVISFHEKLVSQIKAGKGNTD